MKTHSLFLAALLVGCLASTAQATSVAAKNVPYEVVSYADLNIANEADLATLHERVEAAARRVCVRSGVMLRLDFYNPLQQCFHDATARAMEDVKSRSTNSAIVRL
jgi:UrcA family protein